jgi:hypothetical protein
MNANNKNSSNTQSVNTQSVNTQSVNTQKTNNNLYTKDNIIRPRVLFKLLSNVSVSFNLLSRIIILAVSIIIIEKFIEKKILTIKIVTEAKTENELQKELLVILIKELWYIPFVILFYNLIVVATIYVAYSFIWLILKKPAGQGEPPPQQSSQSKTYLYNVKIFQELLYSPILLLVFNLMIIVLVYVIFILLSNNTLKNRDELGIKDEILKNFLSYYKYCNYMFLVFMFIIFEGIDMVDMWNTTKEQTMQQPTQKTE